MEDAATAWPALPYPAWRDTAATLHLWTQIVGKVRLVRTPWVNHSWHVTLTVSARGLSTRLIPHGALGFEMEFDLVAHALVIRVSDGGEGRFATEHHERGEPIRTECRVKSWTKQ